MVLTSSNILCNLGGKSSLPDWVPSTLLLKCENWQLPFLLMVTFIEKQRRGALRDEGLKKLRKQSDIWQIRCQSLSMYSHSYYGWKWSRLDTVHALAFKFPFQKNIWGKKMTKWGLFIFGSHLVTPWCSNHGPILTVSESGNT